MSPEDVERSHKRHKHKHKKSKSRKDEPREDERGARGRNREPGSDTESGEIPCGSPVEAPQSKKGDHSVDTDALLADREHIGATEAARPSIGCDWMQDLSLHALDNIDSFCNRDGDDASNVGEKRRRHPCAGDTMKGGESGGDLGRDRSEPPSHHRQDKRRESARENGTERAGSVRSVGEDEPRRPSGRGSSPESRRSHRSRSRDKSGRPSRREDDPEGGRGRDKVSSDHRRSELESGADRR